MKMREEECTANSEDGHKIEGSIGDVWTELKIE
jgi:hypothetical protein